MALLKKDATLGPDTIDFRDVLLRLSGLLDSRARHELAGQPLSSSMPDRLSDVYCMRRRRDSLFPPGLFGEPAWDMLLDLVTRHYRDLSTSVSSACIASAVPATTALRHLDKLIEAGLVERVHDPLDGRRMFVRPTGHALKAFQDLSPSM